MKHTSFFILTMLILASCQNNETPQENQENSTNRIAVLTKEQKANIEISTMPLELSSTGKTIEFNGKIENIPQSTVAIHSTIEGFVRESSIMPGQQVKEGEILFKLESPKLISLQQEFLDAKIKYDWLEKELKRQEKLQLENATSDKNLNEVKMEFEKAKNTMYASAQQLQINGLDTKSLKPENITRSLSIKSPISGNIGEVLISNGAFVDANAEMTSVNGSKRCAKFTVFEKDLPYIQLGDSIYITSMLTEGDEVKATISFIDPKIRKNGSTQFVVLLSDQMNLNNGSAVRGKTISNTTTGIIIPLSAVVRWEGKSYVFIAKSELEFEMQEVTYEQISAETVELKVSPDWVNNQLVVKGAHALLMVLKNTSE